MIIESGERGTLYTLKMRKANWIGHILRKKCLLKRVTEGKVELSHFVPNGVPS